MKYNEYVIFLQANRGWKKISIGIIISTQTSRILPKACFKPCFENTIEVI